LNVLTLGAVRAAGRRRPGSTSDRPPSIPGQGALRLCQHASPGVACSAADREPRPKVLGPRPGIAWGRLVHVSTPTRAVRSTRRSSARHPSQCPEAHRPSAPGQCPIAVTARRLDSRHPSQYPEAHGPSVPHARMDAPWQRWASGLPSQAERPASQPAGPGVPSRSSHSVPGAAIRPPATRHSPPRPSVRPVPIPTQARASATGGLRHWPTRRARGGEAQWRRSETSFPNRLAAARARAWRRWRGTTAQQQKGGAPRA